MKHISILLLHGMNIAGMDNARQGFLEANRYLKTLEEPPKFKVELAGLNRQTEIQEGIFNIRADKIISEIQRTDLIIIPPVKGDIAEILKQNGPLYPWIVEQYRSGAEVVSLCLGAFVLARTGLLNGRRCATHWRAAGDFEKLFPDVTLLPDKILTDEDRIYTGGGAFSSANLVLYLIEKFTNRETAVYCSKIFQVDPGRHTQSPFAIFSGQKDHGDPAVQQAQEYIEKHPDDKISVSRLSEMSAMTRRTFERRFKKATSNTVTEYIQRVKVETAKKYLETGRKTVNEVMYDVGYTDTKSFRDVFRKYTGITPAEYKNRYKKPKFGIAG